MGTAPVLASSLHLRTLMKASFKHVLLPSDLGVRNERALAIALEMAAQSHARVTLLHVIQRIENIPQSEMRAFYQRLEERAGRRLAQAAREFSRRDVEAQPVVLLGTPAREIVRYAETRKVDLIVLNSHAVGDLTRPGRGLGTTSYKVAILCRCPVLLVK